VHVHEHEFFRRDGLNLFCEIPVNVTTLALGGDVQVPTLDGTEHVKIREGTQTGTTLRLRGQGMSDVNGGTRGDLFATVQVQTPKKLTKEQRHLFEQLAKVLPEERFRPRAREDEQDQRNLFDRVKDIFG
jgi:molecular chaperone DnaJ